MSNHGNHDPFVQQANAVDSDSDLFGSDSVRGLFPTRFMVSDLVAAGVRDEVEENLEREHTAPLVVATAEDKKVLSAEELARLHGSWTRSWSR